MAVHEIGRLQFLVDSHSRIETDRNGEPIIDVETGEPKPMLHLVDFEPEMDDSGKPIPGGEPYRCSCESFNLRCDRPCRHCVEVFEYLLPIVQHLSHWQPKPRPCPRCGCRMSGGICQNYGCEAPKESPKRTVRKYILPKR